MLRPDLKLFFIFLLAVLSAGLWAGPRARAGEDICYACHDSDILDTNKNCTMWMDHSHPVYVKPSSKITVPEVLPLDADGRIYCGTCHQRRKVYKTLHKNQYIYTDKFVLNVDNDNSVLCKLCHSQQLSLTIDEKTAALRNAKPDGEIGLSSESREAAKIKVSLTPSANKTNFFNHPQEILVDRQPRKIIEAGGNFGSTNNLVICETCHMMHMSEGEKLLVMKASNGRLCAQCHPYTNTSNLKYASDTGTHPVNIIPSKSSISENLIRMGAKTGPLGIIYCLTCHSLHQARTKRFLLVESNREAELCGECHPTELENIKGTKHDLNLTAPGEKNLKNLSVKDNGVCSACHLSHRGSSVKLWARPVRHQNDIISDLCLSCHQTGGAAKTTTGNQTHPVGVRTSSHPIVDKRVDLPLFSSTGKRNPKGILTCATCHNPHRWSPPESKGGAGLKKGPASSFLRVSNQDSNLCLKCHRKEKSIIGTAHDPNVGSNTKKAASRKGICAECHVPHNAKAAKLWNRKLPPYPKDDITLICLSCHEKDLIDPDTNDLINSHPINVSIQPLRLGKSPELPLLDEYYRPGKYGKIFCSTCHDTHQGNHVSQDKSKRQPAKNKFLRVTVTGSGDTLCGRCHPGQTAAIVGTRHDLRVSAPQETNLNNSTAAESGVCGACHVAHKGKGTKLWAKPLTEEKDKISDLCLSCHRGSGAAKTTVGQYSHPVGIPSHTKENPLLPLYSEEGEIKEKGVITCATCHNPHQWNQNGQGDKSSPADATNSFLRITSNNPKNSLLCNFCHRQERFIYNTEHDLNISAPESKNAKGKLPGEISICNNCHRVHNAEDGFRLWNRELGEGKDPFSLLCTGCHTPDGIAKNKSLAGFSHPLERDVFRLFSDVDSLILPIYGEGFEVLNLRQHETTSARDKLYSLKHDLSVQSQLSRKLLEKLGKKYTWLAKSYARELNKVARKPKSKKKRKRLMIMERKKQRGQRETHQPGPRAVKRGTSSSRKGKTRRQKKIEKMLDQELTIFADSYSVIDNALKELSGGKIYCSTCHQVHKWDPDKNAFGSGKMEEGTGQNSFLRVANTREQKLCLTCHPDKGGVIGSKHDLTSSNSSDKVRIKSGACDSCHLPHNAPREELMWSSKLEKSDQDRMSQYCRSCHQTGKRAGKKTLGKNAHPLGVRPVKKTSLPLYLKNGQTDNQEGKIYCPTCHDPHQGANDQKNVASDFLRRDMSIHPDLCLDCHPAATEVQFTPHDLTDSLPEPESNKGVCYPCHKLHNATSQAFLWSTETGPRFLPSWDRELAGEDDLQTRLCTGCHSPDGLASNSLPQRGLHKSRLGFIPKLVKKIFPGLPYPVYTYQNGGNIQKVTTSAVLRGVYPTSPLYTGKGKISLQGNISCPTCHDVHLWSGNPKGNQRSDYTNNFLREDLVKSFCSDCHGVSALVKFAYFHSKRTIPRRKKKENKPSPQPKKKVKLSRNRKPSPHWKEKPIKKSCESCHNEDSNFKEKHPLGVVEGPSPSQSSSKRKSLINCLSCHDPGLQAKPLPSDQVSNRSFIRKTKYIKRAKIDSKRETDQAGEDFSMVPNLDFITKLAGGQASDSHSFHKDDKARKASKKWLSLKENRKYRICFNCHNTSDYKQFNPHINQVNQTTHKVNKEICFYCHYRAPEAKAAKEKEFKLKFPLSKICTGCHPEKRRRHPARITHFGKKITTGTSVTMKRFLEKNPGFFPMMQDKYIVCSTCHNPHDSKATSLLKTKIGSKKKHRLRVDGSVICPVCHTMKAEERGNQQRRSMIPDLTNDDKMQMPVKKKKLEYEDE